MNWRTAWLPVSALLAFIGIASAVIVWPSKPNPTPQFRLGEIVIFKLTGEPLGVTEVFCNHPDECRYGLRNGDMRKVYMRESELAKSGAVVCTPTIVEPRDGTKRQSLHPM